MLPQPIVTSASRAALLRRDVLDGALAESMRPRLRRAIP
jgi:hypothetical protein